MERKSSKTNILATNQHKATIEQLKALNIKKKTRKNRHHDPISLQTKPKRTILRDKSNSNEIGTHNHLVCKRTLNQRRNRQSKKK